MPRTYIDTSAAFKDCFFNNLALHFLKNGAELPEALFTNPGDRSLAAQLLERFPDSAALNKYFTDMASLPGQSPLIEGGAVEDNYLSDKVMVLGVLLRSLYQQQLINVADDDNSTKAREIKAFKQNLFEQLKPMLENYKEFVEAGMKPDLLDTLIGGQSGPLYYALKTDLEGLKDNIDDPIELQTYWRDVGAAKVMRYYGQLEQPISAVEAKLFLRQLDVPALITTKTSADVEPTVLETVATIGDEPRAGIPAEPMTLGLANEHYYHTMTSENALLLAYDASLRTVKAQRDELGSVRETGAKLEKCKTSRYISVAAEMPNADLSTAQKSDGIIGSIDNNSAIILAHQEVLREQEEAAQEAIRAEQEAARLAAEQEAKPGLNPELLAALKTDPNIKAQAQAAHHSVENARVPDFATPPARNAFVRGIINIWQSVATFLSNILNALFSRASTEQATTAQHRIDSPEKTQANEIKVK